MTPETDRFEQSLALGSRVALAMPVSLFEVPSMYDLPRRIRRKGEPSATKNVIQIERPAEAYRRRA